MIGVKFQYCRRIFSFHGINFKEAALLLTGIFGITVKKQTAIDVFVCPLIVGLHVCLEGMHEVGSCSSVKCLRTGHCYAFSFVPFL